jgi:hypothetical protein
MEQVFIYGNLMDANVQHYAFKRKVDFSYDVLFDYDTEEVKINGQPAIISVPRRGYSINGAILHLTPEEVDFLQGKIGRGLKKIRVKLNSGREAWTFALV